VHVRVSALLQEYRRQHSLVEVKLITGTSQRLLQEIRSGAADLASSRCR
jgi:DNA-binding transcriptional LysR family regulator